MQYILSVNIEICLINGARLSIPYKAELMDEFSPSGIALFYRRSRTLGSTYFITGEPIQKTSREFDNINEAYSHFVFWTRPGNNVGVAQILIMQDHPELIDLNKETEPIFRKYLKDPLYSWR